jgi:hypothetical protein
MAMASRPKALKIPKNVAMSKTNLQHKSIATFIPMEIFPVQPALLNLSTRLAASGFVIYLTLKKCLNRRLRRLNTFLFYLCNPLH